MKKLVLINTVSWFNKSVMDPFAIPWQKNNPDVELISITDDSLLSESLLNGGLTKEVIRRMQYYFMAAEATGADLIMSTCTTMGPATRIARQYINIPAFNIDEPMARTAVQSGTKLGIFATVPTSAPATKTLLEMESASQKKDVIISVTIKEEAFKELTAGNVEKHNELVCSELTKLQHEVDIIVLGQISLAQIKFESGVPVLQVGHSGFEEAKKLLNLS